MTDASLVHTDGNASQSAILPRRAIAILALVVFATALSGCDKLKARDLLNKGVNAFKNGQYDAAVENFKQAKDLDPSLLNARLYLATAYASQYIPGAPSEQNKNIGKQAVAEFKDILNSYPDNLSAIDGTGSILFQMGGTPYDPKMFEESRTYHEKHITLKPEDPEPHYWVGVIDWTLAFRANAEMRKDYNEKNFKKQVKDTDPLPAAVRGGYLEKYGSLIDEGITQLNKAIELRPDYDDAMAYLNLLYRRKADTVESASERDSYERKADDLVDKVKEIKQKRASQPQPAT